MGTFISHSPEETQTLGESWAREAARGWIVALSGDLGAGKTQLVKGLARGLEITTRVHSPTFSLVNIYSGGRLTMFHIDLYRLDTHEQILSAGLDEYLHSDGIAVIEWAEKWFRPEDLISTMSHRKMESRARSSRFVQIETLNETQRRISYEDLGA